MTGVGMTHGPGEWCVASHTESDSPTCESATSQKNPTDSKRIPHRSFHWSFITGPLALRKEKRPPVPPWALSKARPTQVSGGVAPMLHYRLRRDASCSTLQSGPPSSVEAALFFLASCYEFMKE